MNLCRVLILAVSLLFISGCAHTPDVSAKMNMQAAEYLNPDINGQAAPLILSFYEYFFDLMNNYHHQFLIKYQMNNYLHMPYIIN